MGFTKKSNKDKNSGNSISEQLMLLLDDAVIAMKNEVFTTSAPDSEHKTLLALSHAKGFEEAVQFIYNNLPEELQHGWNTRRHNRGTERSIGPGSKGRGGEGELQGTVGKQKRRSPRSRKKRNWESS